MLYLNSFCVLGEGTYRNDRRAALPGQNFRHAAVAAGRTSPAQDVVLFSSVTNKVMADSLEIWGRRAGATAQPLRRLKNKSKSASVALRQHFLRLNA